MKVYQFNKQGRFMSTVERDKCPSDATPIKPDCEYPKWTGEKWIVDQDQIAVVQLQLTEKKIQTKTRELAIESLKATDEEFPEDYK